jgi:hypothetical protein
VLALRRSPGLGLLAGLALNTSVLFLGEVPNQYADLPLAFYALACLALASTAARPGALALGGACASFAAWTKNEGLALVGISAVLLLLLGAREHGVRQALRRVAWYAAGAAPVLLMVLVFKFAMAPKDPMLHVGAAQMLAKIADSSRWMQIGAGFFDFLLQLGAWPAHPLVFLILLAVGLRFRPGLLAAPLSLLPAGAVAAMLGVYFAGLLVTPHELAWQISTALYRLILQMWPALVFALLLLLRAPDSPAGAPASPSPTRI